MNKHLKSFISFVLVLVMALGLFPVAAFADDVTHPEKTGLFERYDFLDFSAGTAGTLYVGEYTTKLHTRRTDLSLGGSRMPVDVEFYFDEVNLSSDTSAAANPYGIGWNSSYNQTISYDSLLSCYTWNTALGTQIEFSNSGQLTDTNQEIWTEAKDLNDGLEEAVLYLPSASSETDLDDVVIKYQNLSYAFDSYGRLVSISDEYNNTAAVSYVPGSTKQIDRITDGAGRQYVFCYTGGLLSSVVCKDANGQDICVNNTPISVSYTYSANNTLTDTSEGAHYVYDANNRLTDCWGLDKIGYSLSYAASTKNVTSVTKKAAMDTQNPLIGSIVEILKTNLSTTIIEDEMEEVCTYDSFGRVLSCNVYNLDQNASGTAIYTPICEIHRNYGNVITESGSIDNILVSVETNGSTVSMLDDEEMDEFESSSNSQFVSDEPENLTMETRDVFGNILTYTTTEDDRSNTISFTYTPDGNYKYSETDENGNTQYYNYNTLSGILQSVTDACGNETQYSYNGARELAVVSLDVTGLFAASSMETAYTYDAYGRLEHLSYGSMEYDFTYDAWNNVLCVSMNGSPLVSYDYGNKACEGQVQILTYGNGQTVNYTYNPKGNIVSVSYPGQANRFQYTYGQDGSLTSIFDSVLGHTTSYSENTVTVTDAQNHVLYEKETDDSTGDITETIFGTEYVSSFATQEGILGSTQSKTIVRECDEILSSQTETDPLGRTVGKTTENTCGDTQRFYSYNDAGSMVTDYTTAYHFLNTELLGEYEYTYDANGNITCIQQEFTEGNYAHIPDPPRPILCALNPIFEYDNEFWDLSGSFSYTYDEAGQLVSAANENGYELRYVYDQNGNIRLVQHSEDGDNFENSKTFTYNANGLLTGYSSGGEYTGYTLDGMKNPVQITVRDGSSSGTILSQKTLTWGEGRMLTGIQEDANNHVTYTYNQDGLRTRKTVCEDGISHVTDYIWNDGVLVAEKTEDQTITILYGEDGAAEGFVVEYEWCGEPAFDQYAYLKNLQGDVTHIIDVEHEEVAVSYVYDPWGNPTVFGNAEIAAINPCSYRGYYFDEETGWYYLQSRYYNPETGRFLNADDVEYIQTSEAIQGENIFLYTENDYINAADAGGHGSLLAFGLQVSIESGKGIVGFELLIDMNKVKPVTFLFYGGGISISKKNKATEDIIANFIPIINTTKHYSSTFVSIVKKANLVLSAVLVFGKNAVFPKDYCGKFYTVSLSINQGVVAYSRSDIIKPKTSSGALGISAKKKLSIGVSATVYSQLGRKDAIANNLAFFNEVKTKLRATFDKLKKIF